MAEKDKLAAMRKKIAAAREAEKKLVQQQEEQATPVISDEMVAECLALNQRGDGILYAEIHKGKFVYVKSSGMWLAWAGHHWREDKTDLSHDAVEAVAQLYLARQRDAEDLARSAEADGKKDEQDRYEKIAKSYKKRVKRLRDLHGAKACLEWAHKIGSRSLAIVGDEIDQKPWLLPCANGVIDLRTGKLRPGRPEDYLLKAVPVPWEGIDAPCPVWERFIAEIHQEDDELIGFIRRILGYAITGLVKEHFIACFVGEGRNGKGTMFETIKALMGELAWSIRPEMLLEQKNSRPSAGPSPDMVSLHGRRIVIASETDENRKISQSQLKLLTGGDTICAGSPHDKFEKNFIPTHTLFLYTNNRPRGLAADFALKKRLLYIDYPLRFVDDPQEPNERKRDPDLPEKLSRELPGILAWLVRGCLEWQCVGLNPPDKIRAAVEEIEKSEDYFLQFFQECCVKDDQASVAFKDIYGRFSSWFADEVDADLKHLPNKRRISQWLDKHGFPGTKPGGVATRHGLRFKTGVDDDASFSGHDDPWGRDRHESS